VTSSHRDLVSSNRSIRVSPCRRNGVPQDLDFLFAYLSWLDHARGYRWRTIQARRRQLTRYIVWLHAHDRTLLTADHHDVLGWLPDVGSDARRNYLGAVSGLHHWLVLEGFRTDNPVDRVPRPLARRRLPRPITDSEAHGLWLEVLPEHRVVIGLALMCGLRCQELAAARWEDVELGEPPTILVTRRGAKGGNERRVVIPDDLARHLRQRARRHGWLARGPEGQGGNAELMSQWLARLLRDVYDIDASAHCLRHWYATRLLRSGASLRVVQEALGHATLATLHTYTQVTLGEQASAARSLKP